MRPTEILSSEHRVIEQVLDCLEKIAANAERSGKLELEAARTALHVLRTFADRCHHGKEENCLFPMLAKRGFPTDAGPVAVMLHEHESGRSEIRGMESALADAARGEPHAVRYFAAAARRYVELLREHIAKEDNVLFPMAESMLRDADRDEVVSSFEAVELVDIRPGTHEQMLSLADALARKFGVALASDRTPSVMSGCCHAHGAAANTRSCAGH